MWLDAKVLILTIKGESSSIYEITFSVIQSSFFFFFLLYLMFLFWL